jgi:hypothetical protein
MHRYVFIRGYLKSVLRYDSLILYACHAGTVHYVSRDVRICGHLLEPQGVGEQNCLGNTALYDVAIIMNWFNLGVSVLQCKTGQYNTVQ